MLKDRVTAEYEKWGDNVALFNQGMLSMIILNVAKKKRGQSKHIAMSDLTRKRSCSSHQARRDGFDLLLPKAFCLMLFALQ